MMIAGPTRTIVMAKAPVAGLAKTRLAPALGADGAARLAARLLREAVAVAVQAGLGPVELCVAPDASHPLFVELQARHGLLLSVQAPGDLGARMSQALARALAQQSTALLMGTDAPGLDAALLRQAAAALATHDAVFAPTFDGGYALVGLRRPLPGLFDGMTWSTARVMADTRERLRAAGATHLELPLLHDIDEPADLVHLPPGWLPGHDGPTP